VSPDVTYPGVYVEEVPGRPAPIAGVPTSITAFVGRARLGPTDEPVMVAGFADFERLFGGLWQESTLGYAVQQYFANGGAKAIVVRVPGVSADPVAELSGDATAMTGLHALRKADLFNLLCIPPLLVPGASDTAPSVTADVPIAVWAAASRLCKERRAMVIVDAPRSWDTQAAADGVESFSMLERPNATMYFPWISVADPLAGGAVRDFAPSGAVAGVIARIDATRGVWKAPAGAEATLLAVQGLSVNGQPGTPTQGDCGRLNTLGVNCLRTLPTVGHVVWGARTLDGAATQASDWKYVNVRRLLLYIEESIDRGTRWAMFEPNGEPLWERLRSVVTTFLEALFRQGAFQGRTSREAYLVKCDRTTMTQDDIDNGRVVMLVGVAPVKPAEFVIVRIGHLTASAPDTA
jgi:Bacteriophage tail sheath protein